MGAFGCSRVDFVFKESLPRVLGAVESGIDFVV